MVLSTNPGHIITGHCKNETSYKSVTDIIRQTFVIQNYNQRFSLFGFHVYCPWFFFSPIMINFFLFLFYHFYEQCVCRSIKKVSTYYKEKIITYKLGLGTYRISTNFENYEKEFNFKLVNFLKKYRVFIEGSASNASTNKKKFDLDT